MSFSVPGENLGKFSVCLRFSLICSWTLPNIHLAYTFERMFSRLRYLIVSIFLIEYNSIQLCIQYQKPWLQIQYCYILHKIIIIIYSLIKGYYVEKVLKNVY